MVYPGSDQDYNLNKKFKQDPTDAAPAMDVAITQACQAEE